jgi:hypothetical protein
LEKGSFLAGVLPAGSVGFEDGRIVIKGEGTLPFFVAAATG